VCYQYTNIDITNFIQYYFYGDYTMIIRLKFARDDKIISTQEDWKVVPDVGDQIVWESLVLEVESRRFNTSERLNGLLVSIDIMCEVLQ
jgi:hypothetical protein